MGPMTIFDKSALQALSMDEAVWFDAFFGVNVVPVFYIETLADLEKEVAAGKNPEDLVGMLAEKTPSAAYPNVHHRTLLLAELAGHTIELDGRPMISAGDLRKAEDGSVGLHIDEFPEHTALLRWQEHDFLEVERAVAKAWRAELAELDATAIAGTLKSILPADGKISNLKELKAFLDSFCSTSDVHVLTLAFEVLQVPDDHARRSLERWKMAGEPSIGEFLPYTTHVFKVDLLFYLGIERGFISGDRASNRADMAYLYYLPFASVFTSGDKLHQRTVPLFLAERQSYLAATELKGALAEMDAHYEGLPQSIKDMGVLAFASYPPSEVDNVVTDLWDRHMRRDWRDTARSREVSLGEQRDTHSQPMPDDVKQRLESARPISDGTADGPRDGPDYFVVSRRVPARKGKWRMVSEEVENAGE